MAENARGLGVGPSAIAMVIKKRPPETDNDCDNCKLVPLCSLRLRRQECKQTYILTESVDMEEKTKESTKECCCC
jgi:hypothetical protein